MSALDPRTVPLVGRHLVEASAGTGKTYAISTLYARLVAETDLLVDHILVVTFTRAASSELRDRIRRRLKEALHVLDEPGGDDVLLDAIVHGWAEPDVARQRLRRAVADFDLARVSTIHGFCQRALREHAFESGVAFDVRLADDRGPLVRQVAEDLWTRRLFAADRTFVEWVQAHLAFADVVGLAHQAVRPSPPRALPATLPDGLGAEGERLRDALLGARRAWRDHGADAVRIVDRCGLLDPRSYRSGKTRDHAELLDRALRGAETPFGIDGVDEALAYFDPARLAATLSRAALDADTPVPTNAALDALGALRAAWDEAREAFVAERVRLCRAVIDDAPREIERARRAADDLQDFDDLIVDLDRALADAVEGPPLAAALGRRFRAALIDEFQDTDPVQWRIFERMQRGDEARLFLIGDPKQAVYAFRGADLHAYLGARAVVAAEHRWNLDTNHRSDAPLVLAVNRLFSHGGAPFGDARIPFLPVAAAREGSRLRIDGETVPPLELRMHRRRGWGRLKAYADARDLPVVVADRIVDLLMRDTRLHDPGHVDADADGWRPLHPGDVAVLVSSHFEAATVQQALERRGVPCVRYGNVRVFATPEAEALQVLIAAVTRPGDLGAIKAALVGPLIGRTGDDLGRFERDGTALRASIECFHAWRATWDAHGFMRMFQQVLRDTDAMRRVLPTEGGERCLTNLRHLAELVHTAEQRHGLEPLGALAWLAAQRAGRGDGDSPAEVRLESDEAAVQVVTMHVSKGLEYPVVFCPYLWRPCWEDTFPSFHDDDGRLCLQLHPEAHDADRARAVTEARAERLRLAYVALTRARNLCVVSWGRFPGQTGTFASGPLAHLLHPAPDGAAPGSNAAAVEALDDAALFAAAQAFADTTGGVVSVDWAEPSDRARYDRRGEARALQPERVPERAFVSDLRISSFSGLVHALHDEEHDEHDEHGGRDVDAIVGTPPPKIVPSTLPLASFPLGAASGTAYHAILEDLDFRALDAPDARAHVLATLRGHRLDEDLVDSVLRSLADVCATSLGEGAPSLGALARSDRLDELAFTLPAGGEVPLTPERLAAVFEAHAPERLRAPVAARLRRLRFPPLDGYLEGFVDLAFRAPADQRWYVVDYKTNHLGPTLDDYAPAAIDRAMIEGDYVLQYHLYVVALHRFLRRRLAGYDYARDFGGVRYLFVRGMTPATGPSRGVFVDRPTPAMIDALDAVLGATTREQTG